MQELLTTIKKCNLFDQISEAELGSLLRCLKAVVKRYVKGSFIFSAGESAQKVGIVLNGSVHVIKEDYWGDATILTDIGPGGVFGEAFACAGRERLPVSVVSAQECEVLLIDCKKMLAACSAACAYHGRLIQNLITILADKNILLTQKIDVLTRRTTREKLLAYLSAQAREAGDRKFHIPFNRQELAEYLSVDRSALSNELSKMRNEGILRFHKNAFELREAKYELPL